IAVVLAFLRAADVRDADVALSARVLVRADDVRRWRMRREVHVAGRRRLLHRASPATESEQQHREHSPTAPETSLHRSPSWTAPLRDEGRRVHEGEVELRAQGERSGLATRFHGSRRAGRGMQRAGFVSSPGVQWQTVCGRTLLAEVLVVHGAAAGLASRGAVRVLLAELGAPDAAETDEPFSTGVLARTDDVRGWIV